MSDVKLVKRGEFKPREEGGFLLLTVIGADVESVNGINAKRAAYDARADYGYPQAGIEVYHSPFQIPATNKGGKAQYGVTYRLTRTL